MDEDSSVDGSGWSPWSLERLLDLASRLPCEEAALVAQRFGLAVSRADLEGLCAGYAEQVEREVEEKPSVQALQSLAHAEKQASSEDSSSKVMVLQMDGVRVLGQPDPHNHQ